jgi:hypothetical protein
MLACSGTVVVNLHPDEYFDSFFSRHEEDLNDSDLSMPCLSVQRSDRTSQTGILAKRTQPQHRFYMLLYRREPQWQFCGRLIWAHGTRKCHWHPDHLNQVTDIQSTPTLAKS